MMALATVSPHAAPAAMARETDVPERGQRHREARVEDSLLCGVLLDEAVYAALAAAAS